MGQSITRFKNEVERVIRRFARNRTEDEKDDLRQECYLELWKSRKNIDGPAYAYKIAQTTVRRMLQPEPSDEPDPILGEPERQLLHCVSIDPKTGIRTRKSEWREVRPVHFQRWGFDAALDPSEWIEPSEEEPLDAILDARSAADQLPWPEEEVIKDFYGIGRDRKTIRQIAKDMDLSRQTVWEIKQQGMRELRKISGEKNVRRSENNSDG